MIRFVHWLSLGVLSFRGGRIIFGEDFLNVFLPRQSFSALPCEHCLLNNPDHCSVSTSGIFVLKMATQYLFQKQLLELGACENSLDVLRWIQLSAGFPIPL